jgi:hypothetical protein
LTIRTISEPPKITNVAKGGEAKLTCKTTGDAEATITFHKKSDNKAVGTVVPSKATANGVVTTTGVLTISAAKDTDSFDYYCKAIWSGNAAEVKSSSVHLAVLGIKEITSSAWGVVGKTAQFECKSDAILKQNTNGDALLDDKKEEIHAAAQITWQFYDKGTWKASTEDSR